MLPKAQGGGQHNFVEAGQQLGRKCRHLKLLISRYEDAAAKQQQEEERTQQANENTGTETPPISSESRTGGSESSVDTLRDLNFSSESRTGGSESSVDTLRDLNSSILEENTTIVQLREERKTQINEREFVKEVHAVKCLFFNESAASGITTKNLLNGLIKTALPMRNGQQIQ